MKRILLIDDDPLVRRLYEMKLNSQGYEVAIAENGYEGEIMQRETPFDLLITDIIMPNQEGIETIQRIRADFPDLPIIAISGGSSCTSGRSYLTYALTLGADNYLEKPINDESLFGAVRLLLELKEKTAGK